MVVAILLSEYGSKMYLSGRSCSSSDLLMVYLGAASGAARRLALHKVVLRTSVEMSGMTEMKLETQSNLLINPCSKQVSTEAHKGNPPIGISA